MRNKAVELITEFARNDENIVLLTADLGYNVLEPFSDEFPDRFINGGIAEQNLMGVAAGLAKEGKTVFLYSFSNFLTLRCLEHLRIDCAYHNLNINLLAIGGGFPYGSLGMTHQGTEDIAVVRALPNVIVATPSDDEEVECVLKEIVNLNKTCYIRLERSGGPHFHDSIDNYKLGDAIKVKPGEDVVIFGVGTILKECIESRENLSKNGVSVAIYSFPTVKPIDKDLIEKCAKKFKLIVTIEEHNIYGGLGSAVSEVLSEINHNSIQLALALPDTYTYEIGSQDYLREVYKLNSKAIEDEILNAWNNKIKKNNQ